MTEEQATERTEANATPTPETDDDEGEPMNVSRRDFLLGAGTGLVVTAAGAGGLFALRRPAPAAPTQSPAPAQAPAQAPAAAPGQAPAPAPASVTAPGLPATHRNVTLNIDGKSHTLVVDVRESLWEVMTYKLSMASSNVGCDRAQCGACAVVIDGLAVNSCTVLAARLGRGQKILTVDSLSKSANPADLHPVARAFHQEGGLQCGICTRGFIMSTYALLTHNPTPNEADIREALAGNICRCSEYPKIYESVLRAAEDMRKKA